MWHFLFLAFQWHRGKRAFVILSLAFLGFLLYAVAHVRERLFRTISGRRTSMGIGHYGFVESIRHICGTDPSFLRREVPHLPTAAAGLRRPPFARFVLH